MTRRDLLSRIDDQPFSPFRIHVSDGTVLEIRHPGMVIVGLTTAVLPTLWGTDDEGALYPKRWRTVSISQLTQFSDIETSNGKRRKRK